MLGYWFDWNPNPFAFYIDWLGRPVAWYGILFVLGFGIGHWMIARMFARYMTERGEIPLQPLSDISTKMADRLTWYIVLGTVVGARLGHVIFYEFSDYWHRPWDILKTWEGGLASHGGAIGVMLAIWAALRYLRRFSPSMTMLRLLDLVAVPTALVACFIRLGNFVNQELLGIPTDLPWGVMFGNPADTGPLEPRHPVPLYDALANLLIFFYLGYLWRKRGSTLPEGRLIGLFFLLCFTARFFIDFIKMPMESTIETGFLQMGQWLSIPFVFVGAYLIFKTRLNFSKPYLRE